MSESDDSSSDDASERSSFKPGNTAPDGSYIVGRGKPPTSTRFAHGDGRKRGRRPKGQRNLDTEFQEEARRTVTVRENGRERKVSKLRATIIRAFGNAAAGDNPAINTILSHSARLADKPDPSAPALAGHEDAILNDWLADRLATIADGDLGDPERLDVNSDPETPSIEVDQTDE